MSNVTVVIASYKYGHLAAHAIESVLNQSCPPARVLFVDDGVGDCEHLVGMYPEVEFVLRDKNLGTVANFQDMLMRVETERCMFLGADNWLRQDALEILTASDADVVTYDILVVGEYPQLLLKFHSGEMSMCEGGYYWDRSSGHHGSMLYDTELAQQIGYSGRKGTFSEEDLHLYKGMMNAGATREHVSSPLLYYRRHSRNFNPISDDRR